MKALFLGKLSGQLGEGLLVTAYRKKKVPLPRRSECGRILVILELEMVVLLVPFH